ncbi:hypothetical protein GBA52_009037 [Prunus armeniaca]|nr:hypothetical protein GBA52_009037 [Prunus armeniaca]
MFGVMWWQGMWVIFSCEDNGLKITMLPSLVEKIYVVTLKLLQPKLVNQSTPNTDVHDKVGKMKKFLLKWKLDLILISSSSQPRGIDAYIIY